MIFISPPFGNYIHLPNTMSIKGSYTLNHRPGLISQIFKTLRYTDFNGQKMWINKIGLRNPGILYGLKHYNKFPHLMKIRSGKLIDKSINNPFYGVLNMNKSKSELINKINEFFELNKLKNVA